MGLDLKGRRGILMPHVYYGDPSEEFSLKLLKTLVENGADLLEVGIPYSDPIADGPTFIAACERALRGGITPSQCLEGVRKLREEGVEVPIIVTTYMNIPYAHGVESFLGRLIDSGVQGLIIPDLPFEEAREIAEKTQELGIDFIFQVAPSTTEERLVKIVEAASGFLYIINVEGVTGARETLPPSTLELIRRVRRLTDLPLLVGFGISRAGHLRSVLSAGADGVVVGSAIADIYSKKLERPEETLPEISGFLKELKKGAS